MEDIDKNLLYLIVMDYDLNDILSLCQTSKTLNNKICLNDTFWHNKFKHDFPYLTTTKEKAKSYYLEMNNYLKHDIDILLYTGIEMKSLGVIKTATSRGASLKGENILPRLFSILIDSNRDRIVDILEHLSNYIKIEDKKTGVAVTKLILDNINFFSMNDKCRFIRILYSKIYPQLVNFIKPNHNLSNHNLWKAVLVKFKEFSETCNMQDFYNQWIDFYRNLVIE